MSHAADQPTAGHLISFKGVSNFLNHIDAHSGTVRSGAQLGHHEVHHSVQVYPTGDAIEHHPCVVSFHTPGVSAQQYLTADEARVLAQALLAAAAFCDDRDAAQQAAHTWEVAA